MVNFKRIILLSIFSLPQLLEAQEKTGINTQTPNATLDINGDLIIREIPIQYSGAFYSLGVNDKNEVITKSNNISSYSNYLGFSPPAPSHNVNLPITLEDNYITKITGTAIGACYGVMIDYTITFLGKKYLGASLQPISTSINTKYSNKILGSNESVFGKPLEVLAQGSACTTDIGHVLSYDSATNIISVSFFDTPAFFPSAGTFVIFNVEKIRQFD